MTWIAVCTVADTIARSILPVRIGALHLIVVHDGADLFACERACPHEQADLADGRCADGRLFCPRHLAWFDLKDGHISPGWTSRPLRRHAVRIEGDTVLVAVDKAQPLVARP